MTEARAAPATDAIEAAAAGLTREFAAADDVSAQLARLIAMGRAFAGLPDSEKNAATRVHGCQSQLWLTAERSGEVMRFGADSDSLVMRGLLAAILQVYDGQSPDAILRHRGGAVDDLILTLAPSRASGLRSLKQRIRETTEATL
ncbi:MAG: SufE family protein [Sphingopyxis sp.]|uniref:SufE family protein n=1 Tax=Sphingopyxis sp. TaxID=1908224 RepID=UPI003D81254B